MSVFELALIVFAITLIITKSRVLACKRKFVEEWYEAAKINGDPGWIHRIWHAIWTCPMCSGFWIAIPVCFLWGASGFVANIFICFGLNWLLHCLESVLFELSEFFSGEDEKNSDKPLDNVDKSV